MSRYALLLISALVAWAQAEANIAVASKSPYDLAQFIDAHTGFDWKPMWKSLAVDDGNTGNLFPCESRSSCTTELITFLNPNQTILHINDGAWDSYLRYLGTPASGWRFSGAYTPTARRYFQPRHETIRVGSKPFLRISSQGDNGSDVGSETEEWFDLTQPDFAPVFSFSPQGWGLDYRDERIRLNHSYKGFTFVVDQPGETIQMSVDIAFKAGDEKGEYRLGSTELVGVYKRDPGQKKFSLRSAYARLDKGTPIPNRRFKELDWVDFEDGDVLYYILQPLVQIASGPDSAEKRWLRNFLAKCKDTPEKRTIQAALRH